MKITDPKDLLEAKEKVRLLDKTPASRDLNGNNTKIPSLSIRNQHQDRSDFSKRHQEKSYSYQSQHRSNRNPHQDRKQTNVSSPSRNNQLRKENLCFNPFCGKPWTKGHKCDTQASTNLASIVQQLSQLHVKLESNLVGAAVTLMIDSPNPRRLIKATGHVNGSEVDCIIDCGATNSIISSSTAKRLNIPLSNTRLRVTMFNGVTQNARFTEELKFNLAGKSCQQQFIVTSSRPHWSDSNRPRLAHGARRLDPHEKSQDLIRPTNA